MLAYKTARPNPLTRAWRRQREPSEPDRKPIFHIDPCTHVFMTMEEVREVYDRFHLLPGNNKQDLYAMYSMDAETVERYLPVVEQMEKMYQEMCDTMKKEEGHKFKIGPWTIYVCKD